MLYQLSYTPTKVAQGLIAIEFECKPYPDPICTNMVIGPRLQTNI